MRKVVVFHPEIPGNGQQTTFTGPNVGYLVDAQGNLMVTRFSTSTQSGHATFPHLGWTYVLLTVDQEVLS